MARWALNKQIWEPRVESLIKQAAEEFADAMRNEYFIDPQGRTVRVKYAARVMRDGKQVTLWGDWNSSPEFMAVSYAQRRRLIVGGCDRLKLDVDSYNDNSNKGRPIQMKFDFEADLAEKEAMREFEREQAGKSSATPVI